jgi:hypothetical protein
MTLGKSDLFLKVLFSFWCNFKAKGDIILHFGVNKTIQGIIFINFIIFFFDENDPLNRFLGLIVLRAKFWKKIILICQNRTSWQP